MAEQYFLLAADVAGMLQCSISKAHKLMAQWNKELEARGFVTMQGRVPKRYAIDRLGIEARAKETTTCNMITQQITKKLIRRKKAESKGEKSRFQ